MIFVVISMLGILISTLGAALIKSRLNKQKKGLKSDSTQQPKILIEKQNRWNWYLEQKEYDNLILTVRHLRDILYNGGLRYEYVTGPEIYPCQHYYPCFEHSISPELDVHLV